MIVVNWCCRQPQMPAYCNVKGNMMKNVKLKLAVLGALSFVSVQAMATGLVALPTAGYTTASSNVAGVADYQLVTGTYQPNGTTGWVTCNKLSGNYGSGTYTIPTNVANPAGDNFCAVFPANSNTSPVAGFSNVALPAAKQSVTITANAQTLATMTQRAYRNAGNTECVFQKRFVMSTGGTFDYNPQLTGSQRLEVNDFTLGGFSATPTVQAGYFHSATTDSPVYRVGRSFTSAQMQADLTNPALPAAGFVHRPITVTAPAASTEINGVGQTLTGSVGLVVPTAAQQTAAIRTNWVDFMVDTTGGVDEDGTTAKDSPYLYVRSACGAGTEAVAFPTVANTVRIRQTGQETQPWVTILTSGVTRSGANANF